jgi:hypothetical protein
MKMVGEGVDVLVLRAYTEEEYRKIMAALP